MVRPYLSVVAVLLLAARPALADEPEATEPTTEPAKPQEDVVVRGRATMPGRGASDYDIEVGKLNIVPQRDAASLLRLAPGTFLTNEGGTGHPYQVFLRGFDAREGQDIEFSVDGVPINEAGNPHGNGLADTHFVIPELVKSLRVLEGPFAPQQGNFAVAGSARYDLGLTEPGLRVSGTYGSFNTQRLLLTWRPEGSREHTFGGAEVFQSDGFGTNRASKRATAMAGYEGTLGKTGVWRLLLSTYTTHYSSAGILRADDVLAGRKDFFGTNDTQQGGDSSRHGASFTIEDRLGDVQLAQTGFFFLRGFRLRENLTGFLLDPQQTWQTPHSQRGDLIDQQSNAIVAGARGSARMHKEWLGLRQELELGYYGRYDDVDAFQQRDRTGTNVPYKKDFDLHSGLGNIGAYADAQLSLLKWLKLRGGFRIDYYTFNVHDRCALRTQATQSAVDADTECFSADRSGYRSPDQTSSTSAGITQPRVTALVGPFGGFTLSLSHGAGSRTIDPNYVNQDLKTPFAKIYANEGGIAWQHAIGDLELTARSVFFQTLVDRDLFFDQTAGRATLSTGTTRTGWAGNARATNGFFDLATSLTLVRATFDDTKLLIPYVPDVVFRTDGALHGPLPFKVAGETLQGSLGVGVSYVGRRALPFGEKSDTIFTTDVAANVRWRVVQVGVTATNLFDRQYRLSEYNYASDFKSQPYPTLVPARHFVAGEPRAVYGTLTFTLGGT